MHPNLHAVDKHFINAILLEEEKADPVVLCIGDLLAVFDYQLALEEELEKPVPDGFLIITLLGWIDHYLHVH
jgi:hypothetical protein